jgi:hypothetical protein
MFDDLNVLKSDQGKDSVDDNNFHLHPFPNIAKKAAEAVARKSKQKKSESAALVVIKPQQLPLWHQSLRCLPNEIFHSALFNAKNQNISRINLKKADIAIIGEGRITYTGEELRQDDETVWLQLIHLAKELPLGKTVDFTAYSFCKAIRWSIKGQSYQRLRNCLDRMQATALAVYSERLKEGVSLSMVPVFKWTDSSGQPLAKYQVQIAPELLTLFGGAHYTQIEWDQRLDLPDGLATWLHGYYASHRRPHAIKIGTIKRGAGLTTVSPKHLREIIKKALEELLRVKFLASWEIIGDLVHVVRYSKK